MNRRARAFTLIELLCVIAIIALLATLLFPVLGEMRERADNMKCVNNLRQIGTSAHLSANEHDNKFPIIEPDPDSPIYPPDDHAQPIYEALKPYGITPPLLQCPADLKGPNWYAQKNTSYVFSVIAEDENQNAIMRYGRRSGLAKPSTVRLAMDFDTVHPPDYAGGPNRMNVVYADGHVNSGKGVSR